MTLDEFLTKSEEYKLDYYRKLIENSNPKIQKYRRAPISGIHKEIIKEEAELLKKLVPDEDIEKYFAVYHYLLLNGYLSHKNKFKYQTKQNENNYNLGLNVAAGAGCCRNIAVHFTKLINTILNDDNFILIGTRYKKTPKLLPRTPDIAMRKAKEDLTLRKDNIYFSNHLESFDNKNSIVYDPLNFNITRMNYDDISKDNFIGTYDLGLDNVFGTDIRISERLESLSLRLSKSRLLSMVKKEQKLTPELLDLRDIGIEICKDNIDLLKEHQEKLSEGYEYIYKKINKK